MGKRTQASAELRFLDEEALLRGLWPALDQFVNQAEPPIDFSGIEVSDSDVGRMATDAEELGSAEWGEFRNLLAAVMAGEAPLQVYLGKARFALSTTKGRIGWVWLAARSNSERRDDFYFTVKLFEVPSLRPLLRRCHRCGRFFLGERAHVRSRSFCGDQCRFAFHREQRAPGAHAQYVRDWRKLKARQSRRRRTK